MTVVDWRDRWGYYSNIYFDRMLGHNQMAIWFSIAFLYTIQMLMLASILEQHGTATPEDIEFVILLGLWFFLGMAIGAAYILAFVIIEVLFQIGYIDADCFKDGEAT